MNNVYAPFDYVDVNMAQAHGQPNQVYLDSAIYTYWIRSLFQRMTSIFEWEVPDSWLGKPKDFFNYLLFSVGFVGIIDSKDYGYIFQPCTLGPGRNVFRLPTEFKIVNPYDSAISGDYTIGKDGSLVCLTPDYSGVIDTVQFYASRLAFLYSAVNTSLLNCRNPRILGSRSKAGGAALKVVQDKVYSGDPFVILDAKILYPDAKTKDDVLFDLNPPDAKNNYITDLLLADEKTILKEFDSAVGISNLDSSDGKKERLVTSEAEAQLQNSSASSFVWFDCLKDSIKKTKEIFPDIKLDVKLRFSATIQEDTEGGADDVSDSGDTSRN